MMHSLSCIGNTLLKPHVALGIVVEILFESPQPPKGVLYCTNIVSECGNQKRLQRIAQPLGNAQKVMVLFRM
ncbi:hypothetical protein B0A58_09100 [Flavobacterium branchiophilum NBRC 15030 = ATCC 35035]|uniref:hypothetical protein n=1 Tax=Flavobacterium branchiophilum TaxID=55197 RepID=UPI000B5B7F1B|nr:hypothetical protein [Flavobacterium branchiophilum]OXA75267.1 hypothetical protein B0A58_09100 [Flavobacterium branchiophilum NBRC 15030 = ATCC 35035]